MAQPVYLALTGGSEGGPGIETRLRRRRAWCQDVLLLYGSMPLYFRECRRGAHLVGAWAGTVTFSESAKFGPSE
jgi:hypothetical protein